MTNFDQAFTRLMGASSSSQSRAARGIETAWGLTLAEAREFGYTGKMADMPRETAKQIYLGAGRPLGPDAR